MLPRADLVWLDIERPWEENLALITESSHSRFPVCKGGLHEILGVISAKRLIGQIHGEAEFDLTESLQPAVFVPPSMTAMELLNLFRTSNSRMVFVVDEYGELLGIVSLHDLLESVTGEFLSDETEEPRAMQRPDGSWWLDGLIPIHELKDSLGLKTVPDEDKARYHTLSGMMMWLLDRVPHTGDTALWECWRFEVVDIDGKRIDKVLATPAPNGDCLDDSPLETDNPDGADSVPE